MDIGDKGVYLTVQSTNYLLEYDPLVPALFYSRDECQVEHSSKQLLQAYTGISYIILFLSLFSGKIVGLELFGILQIAYFSLAEHSFLNIYLAPMLDFKMFNGLNIKLLQ